MRNSLRSLIWGWSAVLLVFVALVTVPVSPQETQSPAQVPSAPPQAVAPAPVPNGPVVVINPAHGGTDTGARGQDGTVEKDVVLQFARALRDELGRQGYRTVLTRNDDSNPSYDDRAAAANAYREAIFVSLHVSSTGTLGAVRAYYDQMAAAQSGTDASPQNVNPGAAGLVAWSEAQRPYLDASYRLATLIQTQCAQSFSGSPADPLQASIRDLRSVEAPAVAVEVSSVSGANAEALREKSALLAAAIARGIQAFRATGGK